MTTYPQLLLTLLLNCLLVVNTTSPGHYQGAIHSPIAIRTVLVSTLDGQLRALNIFDGTVKWTLREEPVLRAPTTVKQGFTFIPNPQDGSVYVLKEGALKKLPFTIPQLVQASPCKGNDGVLYAGSKRDVWFGIDPDLGLKVETLSSVTSERVCPANHENTVFIGRSEYQVTMFDINDKGNIWNASFSDYSAHLLPEDNSYQFRHYVSASTGQVLCVDKNTGYISWEADLKVPVVAMYLLQNDGLHKLPYTVLGRETMDNLVKNAFSADFEKDLFPSSTPQNALFPTLYVGESAFGLYAMATLVDEYTITYAPKYLGPPLLEGPSPIALSTEERETFLPPKRQIVHSNHILLSTMKTTDGEYIVLGYHEPPTLHLASIIPTRYPNAPIFPHIAFKPEKPVIGVEVVREKPALTDLFHEIYVNYPLPFLLAISLIVGIITYLIWSFGRQSGVASIVAEARSAQTSQVSNQGKQWIFSRKLEVPDGWLNIGKVLYNPSDVLGRGCEGTVVYRGKFDGREVAVKRVVSEFVRLVDREADLLRESDTHPHVIRYFCMESDSQFRYLALELCSASLHDYVEVKKLRNSLAVSKIEILRQASEGLAHLHTMNIVHRDMKPQNVLISVNGQRIRIVISDFGLCKRMQPGKHSLSQRSGLAGTDGWIAPEALFNESLSFPVDVFSLGCIFYYVLSDGKHPFGDNIRRSSNIMNGHYDLRSLDSAQSIEMNLIESMIQRAPADRPLSSAILLHPFFWSDEKRLQFFGDVSDRVEKDDETSPVVKRLETNARAVVCGGWRNIICTPLAEDLRKFRTYKSHSVRDLLRAMRNKKHHYRELPVDVRESLGHIPEGFLNYWTSRFPLLLMHAYEAMECCANESVFRGYYSDAVRQRIIENVVEEVQCVPENQKWERGVPPKKPPGLNLPKPKTHQ